MSNNIVITNKEELEGLTKTYKPLTLEAIEAIEPIDYIAILEGTWCDSDGNTVISFIKKTIFLPLLDVSQVFYVNTVKAHTDIGNVTTYALIGTIAVDVGLTWEFALYLTVDSDGKSIELSYNASIVGGGGSGIGSAGTLTKKC